VLVAEDDKGTRETISRNLKRICELLKPQGIKYTVEVETAEHGIEAYEKFSKAKNGGKPFNFVIIDWSMSRNNGYHNDEADGDIAIAKMLADNPSLWILVNSGEGKDEADLTAKMLSKLKLLGCVINQSKQLLFSHKPMSMEFFTEIILQVISAFVLSQLISGEKFSPKSKEKTSKSLPAHVADEILSPSSSPTGPSPSIECASSGSLTSSTASTPCEVTLPIGLLPERKQSFRKDDLDTRSTIITVGAVISTPPTPMTVTPSEMVQRRRESVVTMEKGTETDHLEVNEKSTQTQDESHELTIDVATAATMPGLVSQPSPTMGQTRIMPGVALHHIGSPEKDRKSEDEKNKDASLEDPYPISKPIELAPSSDTKHAPSIKPKRRRFGICGSAVD
jgi:CheY-like chemotaxis protein